MNENNLALNGAENVEATTTEEIVEQVAEPEKVYTEEEFQKKFDEAMGKKIPRREAKIRKEYEKKYARLENVLRAGTGKQSVDEIADVFEAFYKDKGVEIPKETVYSDRDTEILARAEADDIIKSGLDEVIEEVDRLAAKGYENMNARERATFKALAEYRQTTERGNALAKIGVGKDVYESKEFTDFASKFNPNTPIEEVYRIYDNSKPKKEFKSMGSIKNTTVDTGVKDYYSYEEAMKFTVEDFNKNPALYKAVQNSMAKWK